MPLFIVTFNPHPEPIKQLTLPHFMAKEPEIKPFVQQHMVREQGQDLT